MNAKYWLIGAASFLLIGLFLVVGLKAHRFYTAIAAVEHYGGKVYFDGPAWVHEISDDRPVALLDRVYRVNLGYCPLDDSGFRHLAGHLSQFGELEALNLRGTDLSDASAPSLGQFPDLRDLSLASTAIGDRGLSQLSCLSALTHLDLARTRISNSGLIELEKLVNLVSLNLDGCRVSDDATETLRRFPKLDYLSVANTDMTDAAVSQLSGVDGRLLVTDD